MQSISDIAPIRSSESRSRSRIAWIDLARGGAIIAVVFGHVWRGLHAAGLIPDDALFRTVDQGIYLFHMPVFFILSGFVFRSGNRPSVPGFLGGRVLRILYPMLLWYYLFIGVNVLMSAYVNTPYGIDRLLGPPIPFDTHLWFLWALLLIQLACMPLALLQSRWQVSGLAVALIGLSLFVRFGTDFFDPWAHQAILYLPFFLLGVLAKETSCELLVERMSPQVLFLAGVTGFLLAEPLQFSADPSPQSRLLPSLLSTAGFILMAAGISRKSLHSRLSGLVMHVGKASMAIYLVHIFFTAFFRIGLTALEIHDLWLHVIIGTLSGVFGPLLVLHLADRWNLRRALGF